MLKTRFGLARANSLRAAPIFQLLLTGALAVGIGWIGHQHGHGSSPAMTEVADTTPVVEQALQNVVASAPVQALAKAEASVASAVAPRPTIVTRETELDEGQTFSDMLKSSGAAQADALAVMNALAKIYDMRHLQAGQDVTLSFSRTVKDEILTGAVFTPEATKEISITRNAQGTFVASEKLIPVVRQRLAAAATIDSSLYEAGNHAGVPQAIMASLIRIYSHEIDFQRDIHPGDQFEILYDQPMTAKGKAVGEGSIVYANLHVGGKTKPVYRVTFSDKTIDYFDEKGQSIRRALLRTPVAAAHITSGFGMRMHPILGYSKMHKGIDFGASTGTPIFAAGNGVIVDIGFKNGYGRYIRIRHNGTLSTAYAHMSRFGSGMYRGGHVSQGEVIGYVGMSGRATGPHLHYEVLVNNQQVNPMSVNLPTGRTLEGKLLTEFKKGQNTIRQEFAALLAKNTVLSTTPRGFIKASAVAPAFAVKVNTSCGLRGGC